jgi:hypothetical protein
MSEKKEIEATGFMLNDNSEELETKEVLFAFIIKLIKKNDRIFSTIGQIKDDSPDVDIYLLYGILCSLKLEIENIIKKAE